MPDAFAIMAMRETENSIVTVILKKKTSFNLNLFVFVIVVVVVLFSRIYKS
jgi:hypothetical protein